MKTEPKPIDHGCGNCRHRDKPETYKQCMCCSVLLVEGHPDFSNWKPAYKEQERKKVGK